MPSLPNFHLPKPNLADRGTNQIKVNKTPCQTNHHGHPVRGGGGAGLGWAPGADEQGRRQEAALLPRDGEGGHQGPEGHYNYNLSIIFIITRSIFYKGHREI